MKFSFKSINNIAWEHTNKTKELKSRAFSNTDVSFHYIYFINVDNIARIPCIEINVQWHLIIQFKNNSVLTYIADTNYYAGSSDSSKGEEMAIALIKDALQRYADNFETLKGGIGFSDKFPIVFTRLNYAQAAKSLLKQIYLKR